MSAKLIIDKNARAMFVKVKKITNDTRRGIRQGLYFIGKQVSKDTSNDILRKPRFGNVYFYRTRSGSRRRHIASVRGEAPANRTGTLRRSINFNVRGYTEMKIGYEADYGKYLEDQQKLNRPALLLNIKKNEKTARIRFEQELKKALKGK